MGLQNLRDYVENFSDNRRLEEWEAKVWKHTCAGLDKREAQRAAFMEVFPSLQLPDLPCE